MLELVCKGCGGIIDAEGIEPFTLCECSDCGTEIIIPQPFGYLLLEKKVGTECHVNIFEGFDKSQNLDSEIFILDRGCPEYEKYYAVAKEESVALSGQLGAAAKMITLPAGADCMSQQKSLPQAVVWACA